MESPRTIHRKTIPRNLMPGDWTRFYLAVKDDSGRFDHGYKGFESPESSKLAYRIDFETARLDSLHFIKAGHMIDAIIEVLPYEKDDPEQLNDLARLWVIRKLHLDAPDGEYVDQGSW